MLTDAGGPNGLQVDTAAFGTFETYANDACRSLKEQERSCREDRWKAETDPKRPSARASSRDEAIGTILALDEAGARKRQMGTDQPPLVGGKLVEEPQPG